MDPASVGSSQWSDIGQMLTDLWLVVLFVVLFATNMILGHNMIPSLVSSQHISSNFQKLRPALYGFATISFTLAIFFLVRVIDAASVLRDFWPEYWI